MGSSSGCRTSLLRRRFEKLGINQVFAPTRRALIANEHVATEEWDLPANHLTEQAARGCLVERHSRDLGDDVNASGDNTDLVDASCNLEVTLGHASS